MTNKYDKILDAYREEDGGSGSIAFTDLTDVPNSYTGQGGKVVAVKTDVSGLEFITASTGTTSIDGGWANSIYLISQIINGGTA